jgi:hypothetical protein
MEWEMRFANDSYWGGTYKDAAKGLWPHRYEIAQGTVLYRFINLKIKPSGTETRPSPADGPWWFEFEHFQTIKKFAEGNKYPFGYAARMFAAILYEWSEVDAVVKAQVVHGPLLTWKGKGKQVVAKENDARDVATVHGIVTDLAPDPNNPTLTRKMTPTQGPLEVLQLFIPGLGRPHYKFESFMKLKSMDSITTG